MVTIGMIAAVSQNGVIGIENKIPFDYPEDLKFFKNKTMGSTIIMGRKTFEGIGRPLPGRDNFVISSTKIENEKIQTFSNLDDAVLAADQKKDIWLIGGAKIYQAGMDHADRIVLTITPDVELREPAIRFPWINPKKFYLKDMLPMSPGSPLTIAFYYKLE